LRVLCGQFNGWALQLGIALLPKASDVASVGIIEECKGHDHGANQKEAERDDTD
jgi:hypothetical protein